MNSKDPGAMGRVFDAAQVDDSFYLPQSAFENPDFNRGLKMFLSPDGKAARFIISLEGDPSTPEGIARVEPIQLAAKEAIKGTPLRGPRSRWAAPLDYQDMQEGTIAIC